MKEKLKKSCRLITKEEPSRLSYKININRVEVFGDLSLDEANGIKNNEDVKYIQICVNMIKK